MKQSLVGWQPIETAPEPVVKKLKHPKTGKEYDKLVPVQVIACLGDFVTQSCLMEDGRFERFSKKAPPTHWMPLPEAPKS